MFNILSEKSWNKHNMALVAINNTLQITMKLTWKSETLSELVS